MPTESHATRGRKYKRITLQMLVWQYSLTIYSTVLLTRASRECGWKAKKPTTQPRGAVCLPMAWKPTTPPTRVKSLSRHKAVTEREHRSTKTDKKGKAPDKLSGNKAYKKQNENQPSFEVRFSLSMVDHLGLEPRTDRLWAGSSNQLSYWSVLWLIHYIKKIWTNI